jgi:hypothetical protein
MLVNELTTYELEQIIKPVIQMQPMSRVCSEIGDVLGIPKANRKKIQEQDKSRLRYKGFDVFFYDFRWLRGRGACMSLQFKRSATDWQKRLTTWFGESHRRMDKVCGEVVQDLKSISLKEIPDIKLTSTDVTVPANWLSNKEGQFRVFYPHGVFNDDWKQGYDISPLMISDDYNLEGGNWFVSWTFNPGAFVRRDGKTILRENWQEYANDLSKATDAWVARNYHPDDPRPKSFEEWCEDMILDFGDEIAPQLPSIWQEIQSERGNAGNREQLSSATVGAIIAA